ncbi:hypothetical protein LMZ02_07805 [Paenibacillus macerans]|uniref:Uncharacterized protein n=1 Tax=Paenibacillus macerans TaxID=44252 RepID=A0A090XGZ2_PAEMA|nr:hypothetical protein [Paenibacillus macerans]KFM83677.1 hypothetical protein DJ90_5214 [Paenibacillus macerans]MEC0329553.1 hypothetical protein [Paenibacillus macerans]UMV49245.1 hypothetical protein LMZ02_07805 [Paenibacillus macerans]GBK65212.1 hypothetical protein PbDSM24746_52160 [Paenibacillus macerans]GIP09480.1 hypothetical protein J1TS5_16500 [Paenibacillus macerans]
MWEHFFFGKAEKDGLLLDFGLYSVFLQVHRLNEEKITRSLDAVLDDVGSVLEQSWGCVTIELEHIETP